MAYPPKLTSIINLFSSLSDIERRETLISYAEQAKFHEPREGEIFVLEDIRKDEECSDTVAIHLKLDAQGGAHFRITLGAKVQTLTRALSSILCKGLNESTLEEILEIPSDFVPKIVGAELIRLRSQTVYYLLTRIKGVAKVWLQRQMASKSLTARNGSQY